jgi:hypothetical protein
MIPRQYFAKYLCTGNHALPIFPTGLNSIASRSNWKQKNFHQNIRVSKISRLSRYLRIKEGYSWLYDCVFLLICDVTELYKIFNISTLLCRYAIFN